MLSLVETVEEQMPDLCMSNILKYLCIRSCICSAVQVLMFKHFINLISKIDCTL